jgi:hypothetical protein
MNLQIGDKVTLDYAAYFAWYDGIHGKWQPSRFAPVGSPRLQPVDTFAVQAVHGDMVHIVYQDVDLIVPAQFTAKD